MARRLALIISNGTYDDPKLSRLSAPEVDAQALESVLKDPQIGYFDEVTTLINQDDGTIRVEVDQFFRGKGRDDTLLLYFSGHGVLDANGRLYLATKDTRTDALRPTSLSSSYVSESMDNSRSKRQILILDCCHSGAFARGSRAVPGQTVGTKTAFEGESHGRGRVILTSTDETQYAWEGDEVQGGRENSRFTHHLVQGLKTGKADKHGTGRVTVDDLYEYVYDQVKADSTEEKPQTPRKFSHKQEGELILAKNLRVYPTDKKPPPRRVGGEVTLEDLRKVLDDVFEGEDIENIAFDLGLDERRLGQTKISKIRAMLKQLEQRDQLDKLIDWLNRNVPDLFEEVFGKRGDVYVKLRPRPQPMDRVEQRTETVPSAKPAGREKAAASNPFEEILRHIPTWGWGIVAVLVLGGSYLAFQESGNGRDAPDSPAGASDFTETENAEPTSTLTATPFVPQDVMGFEWIEIPAGPFMMGANDSDELADDNEKQLHEVTLDTYWISRFEVTNAQYKEFVDATGHRVPNMTREDYTFYSDEQYSEIVEPYIDQFNWDVATRNYPEGLGNHPVSQVSWEDAVAYTDWLGKETGLTIALPSEAEWEKAARGGADSIIYPWGNEFNGTLLNYCDDSCEFEWADKTANDAFQNTSPVGSFPAGASPYGVEDMAGNVWEWTRSEYTDSYPYQRELESVDSSAAEPRVLRGGSWAFNRTVVRASGRGLLDPGNRNTNVGFRVVVLFPSS
ncbi:MAG: SUMF1/EgtB/PvdO family nonheme iron enzyme [Ardenticatenaceae bacterium]|nr:SUMF1/EgtB/PvdO family nonheme iron enzyme [Ardenticatenaceae bacterium]